MNTARSRLTIAAVAGALALGAAGAGVLQASAASATQSPAGATGGSTPRGNAGTIKVNGLELAGTPRNEPHLGCDVTVAFYGYASGVHTAKLSFEGHAPTLATSGSALILADTLTFSGGKGLDGSRTYHLDLSRFPVHPKQGVHVKLTVNVPGSKGADVKHKVFWVQPCTSSPSPTPTPTTPTPTSTTPSATPTVGKPSPTPSTSTSTSPSPTPTSTGGGTCTGAAASSPDCTTVSTPPHFTG